MHPAVDPTAALTRPVRYGSIWSIGRVSDRVYRYLGGTSGTLPVCNTLETMRPFGPALRGLGCRRSSGLSKYKRYYSTLLQGRFTQASPNGLINRHLSDRDRGVIKRKVEVEDY